MPSWAIHLATGQKLSKNMNQKEKQAFLLGNILPDVNNGYLVKGVSKVIIHDLTHCYKEGRNYKEISQIKGILQDYKNYIKNNKSKLNEPIVYGYFVHLLTDYYWNSYTFLQKGVFADEKLVGIYKNDKTIFYGDSEEIRIVKTKDFNCFSKYLYENVIEKVKFEEPTLVEQTKQIPEIAIEKEDIVKVNEYFEKIEQEIKNIDEHYEIYTRDEFEKCLNESIEFILNVFQN